MTHTANGSVYDEQTRGIAGGDDLIRWTFIQTNVQLHEAF